MPPPFSTSPSQSQWSPAQHGVDHNGVIRAPVSPASSNGGGHGNGFFGGGGHGDTSYESQASRTRRGSSPGKRALQWFTRSRSTSPAAANTAAAGGDRSGPPSPSSFVVRSVVKQPGGVSHEYDVHGRPIDPAHIEDGQSAHYRKVKSQPLTSLVVPPGGPGGGTGYGTAQSSNDGRPERERFQHESYPQQHRQPNEERGRSRSKSPSRPPSPGAINAGAFRTKSGNRVSPGPMSYSQQAQHDEHAKQDQQEQHLARTRFNATAAAATASRDQAPSGPRSSPFAAQGAPNGGQFSTSPRQSSPLAPSVSPISAQAHSSGVANTAQHGPHGSAGGVFSMPVRIPDGSRLPPVIPLDGVPSPVKIPFSSSQQSRPPASPLGSVSAAGSPGGPLNGNYSHDERYGNGGTGSQSNSPNMASRWFKGLFGKSPRLEERDDGMYSNEGSWMRQNSGNDLQQSSPHAWSDGSPLAGARDGYGNSGPRGARDHVEADAMARKKHSMLLAARIEDEHRNQLINGSAPLTPQRSSTTNGQPWSSRQILSDAPHLTDEPVHSPPQSRSPPGRKPPPRFTAHDLEGMSEAEREQVAREVDPDDRLSKLEGRLTPAQQIIAETRSKMSSREEASNANGKGKQSMSPSVQRGFDPNRRSSTSDRPPTLPTKQEESVPKVQSTFPQQKSTIHNVHAVASQPEKNVSAAPRPAPAATAAAGTADRSAPAKGPTNMGLSAGAGPLPNDMPMSQALQEMMIRFYRFERYAVPLMRSLEGRLIDVERDNQMAVNGDAMSANSVRDREMDKWVGQMTSLMRHEVGQLQAATREIRQSRELLAGVAKSQGVAATGSAFLPGRQAQQPQPQPQVSEVQSERPSESPQVLLSAKQPSTASKKSVQKQGSQAHGSEIRDQVGDLPEKRVTAEENRRQTNISSSSFTSAVAKPSANEAVVETSNASPNGRMRYTHALGKPMHDGRISPAVSPSKSERSRPAALDAADEVVSPLAVPSSPSLSDRSGYSRRAMSVDERLKALVNDKARSPSTVASMLNDRQPSINSQLSLGETARDDLQSRNGSESTETSFEKLPPILTSKIGDDYQIITMQDSRDVSSESIQGEAETDQVKEATADLPPTLESDDAPQTVSQHRQTPSTLSTQTTVTIKPTTASRSLTMPPAATTTSTVAPISPNVTGNSLKLAMSFNTPTRQRSVSPINMVPTTPTGIKTASQGLRARAQSYLQNADTTSNGGRSAGTSPLLNAKNISPASSAITPSKPLASPSKLTTSVSTSVLRSRDINSASPSPAGEQSSVSAPDESLNGDSAVRPLSIKKSSQSINKSRSERTWLNGSGSSIENDLNKKKSLSSFTSKQGTASSSTSNANTPARMSIKDRVAFFDAAQRA